MHTHKKGRIAAAQYINVQALRSWLPSEDFHARPVVRKNIFRSMRVQFVTSGNVRS